MLKIKNLHAKIEDREILKGISLNINKGEVHAIMGPNGSGKSTFASVLVGKKEYEVTQGSMLFNDQNLLKMSPEERAQAGLFLAFQYPLEIPGLTTINFLKTSLNEIRKSNGQPPLDAISFLKHMKERIKWVEIDETLLSRSLNEGFSGGEKKRNEIFQMAMLEPKLSVLDETDSGLDVDALKVVASGVNKLRTPDTSFIIVTHYQRLLDYIKPDFVHVLYQGKIVKSGDSNLAITLEAEGYDKIKKEVEI